MKQYTPLALRHLNSAINNNSSTKMSIITPPMIIKPRTKVLRIKQSFTLVELLVVILIIGILAAILLPVFAKARNKARHSVDLSNLKQIATSAITYTLDNKDLYPYREIWNNNGFHELIKKGNYDERDIMASYLGDLNGILTCPHSPSELDIQGSTANLIRIDYSRYWGTGYGTTGSMKMAGDPLVYDGKEFRILASDYMEEKVSGASFGSHEDSRDILSAQETLTPVLQSRWGKTLGGAADRGHLDLNYVFDDGHAITISGIMASDDRFTNLPKTIKSNAGLIDKWLPPEE